MWPTRNTESYFRKLHQNILPNHYIPDGSDEGHLWGFENTEKWNIIKNEIRPARYDIHLDDNCEIITDPITISSTFAISKIELFVPKRKAIGIK